MKAQPSLGCLTEGGRDTPQIRDSLENADRCARRKAGTATNSRLWNWLAVPGLPPGFASHVSGLIHFNPGNRRKSVSAVCSVALASIANAARCASVVRFPPLPSARRKPNANSAWRGPGFTGRTIGRWNHDSTCVAAWSTVIGLRKTRGLVHKRMNPNATTQGMPTDWVPERLAIHQRFAPACHGEDES